MIVLADAENHTIETIFIHLNTIRDRQTDRQTESLWLLQRSALRAMLTLCNNTYNSIISGSVNEYQLQLGRQV